MTRLQAFRIARRQYAVLRRADLRARGYCRNGELHGPATDGGLCAECRKVHRGIRLEVKPPLRVLIREAAASITVDTNRRGE